ncbi:cell division protein ZapB [Shigella flexneri]
MEMEEAERKKQLTVAGSSKCQHQREELERENDHLKEQRNGWQEHLQALLGRMEEV